MRRSIANAFVCLLALTVAVPESYARRLGAGRSVGRQAPAYRQRSDPAYQPRQAAPTPPPAYVPRPAPGLARQSAPIPVPLRPNVARQGGSAPWGGMLGGALVGLGLGSLLSSHDRNTNTPSNNEVNNTTARTDGTVDPNAPNQISGADGSGTTAGGAGQAVQPAPAASQIGTGSIWLWGVIALAAFLLFRRMRARSAQRLR